MVDLYMATGFVSEPWEDMVSCPCVAMAAHVKDNRERTLMGKFMTLRQLGGAKSCIDPDKIGGKGLATKPFVTFRNGEQGPCLCVSAVIVFKIQ